MITVKSDTTLKCGTEPVSYILLRGTVVPMFRLMMI